MPHLTIEYSANLDGTGDIAGLCRSLHAAMLATGLFELGAIRVRALCAEDYAVADLLDGKRLRRPAPAHRRGPQ